MRQTTARVGGAMIVAAGALALAWGLPMAGPAETAGSSPDGEAMAQPQPQPHPPAQPTAQPPAPITPDAWLAAQPLAADPPEALPEGFWKVDAGRTPLPSPSTTDPRLEIVGQRGRQNVVLHDGRGHVHELTGFTQPQHVYDAAISDDGALACVWHMAFAPRQVSVYDLATRELLHRFAPGSGGDLRWAASEPVLLLETAGMGMGGARVTAFAPDGRTLVRTGVGSQALSPDDRWVLSVSWRDGTGRVEVFGVATGERVFGARAPESLAATLVEAGWDEQAGPILRIVTDRQPHRAEAFELARLAPILERLEGAPGG